MEALAVEMTGCQCILTAKRDVVQGFPPLEAVWTKIRSLKGLARLQGCGVCTVL